MRDRSIFVYLDLEILSNDLLYARASGREGRETIFNVN